MLEFPGEVLVEGGWRGCRLRAEGELGGGYTVRFELGVGSGYEQGYVQCEGES